jgi:hypothetical protein
MANTRPTARGARDPTYSATSPYDITRPGGIADTQAKTASSNIPVRSVPAIG